MTWAILDTAQSTSGVYYICCTRSKAGHIKPTLPALIEIHAPSSKLQVSQGLNQHLDCDFQNEFGRQSVMDSSKKG